MTFGDFDKFQAELLAEVVGMRNTKGREYAGTEDRFANFRRLADDLGIPDYQVGWVYTRKHLDSIASYMKNGKTFSSETIRGRFVDAIVYLTLIAGMLEERALVADDLKVQGITDENSGKHQPFEYDDKASEAANG